VDGEAKVRGATRYAADLPIPGVLHARLVLATEAHARIASIETGAARAVPGVVAVLTAADLPVSPDAPGRAGEPLAREEVVFAGQPVAMVVAETEATATDGVDQVVVDLEPLQAVLDVESAMAPGAPRARTVELNLEPTDNKNLFQEHIYGPATGTVPPYVTRVLTQGWR